MKTKINDLVDTLDYFINQCEAEMEGLSWEIQEETNFEDNIIDSLSDYYDDWQNRLNDLKEIKNLLTPDELPEYSPLTDDSAL